MQKNVTVTLMSWTEKPVETIYALWEASKNENPLLNIDDVHRDKAESLFGQVLAQNIPIGEHINFVFMLENVSVSFREQMVRHRVGTHVGENFGVDIVPDLTHSSWWSQSMRIQSMSKFSDNRNYRIPQSVKAMGTTAIRTWELDMHIIQDLYNYWIKKGLPMEDARDLIPLGATHRISWSLNLASLMHIVSKRSCWILQSGLWAPVIQGIIRELRTKVDPLLGDLALPPCVNSKKEFTGCVYELENKRRVSGEDAHDPCPLYNDQVGLLDPPTSKFQNRVAEYKELWGSMDFASKANQANEKRNKK